MVTAEELAALALAGSLAPHAAIPITFIGTDGKPSSNFLAASPCIQVRMANAETGLSEVVWGCLDTGADHIYIDTSVITRLKLPAVSQISANALATSLHRGKIAFPPTSVEVVTSFVSRSIREHGNGFDVLIGRQVLNAGRFEYDLRGGHSCRFILR